MTRQAVHTGPWRAVRPCAPYFFEGSVVVGLQAQSGEYAMDLQAAQHRAAADARRMEAASLQGELHVLNPKTGTLEAVSAAAALADRGLRGLDFGGRTVMRVAALSTAAGGAHRVVLEEELRGTSGRVLFNGCYVPTATAAIPWDGGAGGGGGGKATAATMTDLTVTLPAPPDPMRPPVGCAWVQAVSDGGPTRRLPVGPSVPLLLVPDHNMATEITAAAHVIRQGVGAYRANCFVKRLGNCMVPAACNMNDLAFAMKIIDILDMRHTRQGGHHLTQS